MSRPIEYRLQIQGFGVWRIVYVPEKQRWSLSCNARIRGEQWIPVGDYSLAECAALAVAERSTGLGTWDGLRYPAPPDGDLKRWRTDASEGVQADAVD